MQKITGCRIDSVTVYTLELNKLHQLTAEMGLGAEATPCGLFTVHGLSSDTEVTEALNNLIEVIEKVVALRLGDTVVGNGPTPIQGLLPTRI